MEQLPAIGTYRRNPKRKLRIINRTQINLKYNRNKALIYFVHQNKKENKERK